MKYQGFIFNEATDWATGLEDSYTSVNESYDRREKLEQKNDETRLKNAEVLEKLPEEILSTVKTLAPAIKALNKKRRDEMERKGWDDLGDEKVKTWQPALESITKIGELENFVSGKALKDGDNVTLQTMDWSGAEFLRAQLMSIRHLQYSLPGSLQEHLLTKYPTPAQDVAEFQKRYKEWETGILGNMADRGLDTRFVKSQLKETFDTLRNTHNTNENNKLTKLNYTITKGKMVAEFVAAFNSDKPVEAFAEKTKYFRGYFIEEDGSVNMAKVNRSFLNLGIMAVDAGLVNPDKFESVLLGPNFAKGDNKNKALLDKLGYGPEYSIWASDILTRLETAKSKIFQNKQTENDNYGKQYEIDLRKLNGPDGEMTKAQIVNYIYTNPETKWDHRRGNIPQSVLKMISAEAGDDAEWLPTVQKKAKLGLLTVEDVMKLEDINLRRQYMPAATAGNNFGMDTTTKALMNEAIPILATGYTQSKDANNRSEKWVNVKQQAELAYPSIFAKLLNDGTASSPSDAHGKTMAILKEKVYNGDFDKWSQQSSNTLKLLSAAEYIRMDHNKLSEIKDAFNNNTYNKILPGFEDEIKQALELPSGSTQVLPAFKQLGKRYGIYGGVIQHNQVTLAKLLKGEKEPIKSEVVLAFEKLPKDQQELLSKFTTQSKLARAKFLAFKKTGEGEEEGTITWLEMQTIHPDVAKFIYQQETGRDDYPVTPTLGKLELRKGDWKKLPGATRIGYTVWDGKEWKYSSSRGKKNQEWIGGVEDYKDVDGYYKPFEGTSNDLTTTFFGGDEPINTAEEGGPKVGDWYKVTNRNIGVMDIGDLAGGESKPYVIWNGKEWVYSAVKGKTPNEYQGPQPLSKIDEEEEFIKKQAQNY
jgi:hypothetical protein